MKAKINRDACIACGVCIANCPQVYKEAKDGRATVDNTEISDNVIGAATAARDMCPTSAIIIN